ncbi:FHA domain-containing protein [Geodermatophilus sp. URMC 61]|uniref:FHA domain-containing protein n=1 Tax=Geodermatophilus sp. URMC 61 TaxID=3423411 RepID=UPI00406C0641
MDRETVVRDWSTPLEVRLGGQRWIVPVGESLTIGRDDSSSIPVDHARVSRHHATVDATAEGWLLVDHSRNGVFLDGRRMPQVLITTPTAVALGHPVDGVVLTLAPVRVGAGPETAESTHAARTGVHDVAGSRITVGRLADNDVVIDDLLVSRHHAVLERVGGRWHIRDAGSANGTYLNGQRVTEADVAEGDLIGIGHAVLHLSGNRLLAHQDDGDVDIEAADLVVTRDGRRLLDGLALRVAGRSLLAILGPSGSGKSTLLGALTGTRPADAGVVRYGGRDLYADYEEVRHRIGVVPQDDILHPQLSVLRALSHAARLRFPPDAPREDRTRRIEEVLEELGLTERAHQRIEKLSGGQRKRTSVALELLTRPSLLFLDEPTSGLDPGLDKQVMQTLRALADSGRTVVVVTHSVLNLEVCDHLVVLAPGGRMAYDGPPDRVLEYFGVADFADVFLLLERQTGVDWHDRLRRSGLDRRRSGRPSDRPPPEPAPPPRGSALVQYRVLSRRTLDVLLADRTYLAFLGLLPVLLSGLAHTMTAPRGLSVSGANPVQARQLLLVLILGGALMGTASSVRELVKERTIYHRERAIGLSRVAYVAAKVTVLTVVTAVQAAAFAALAMVGRPGPDGAVLLPSGELEVALAVVAVTVASMVVGLVISALISNADRGMPLLVVVVMVQFVLSGGLFGLAGRPGLEQLSWAVPSRWAYAMGAVTMDLRVTQPTTDDPLWRHSATTWLADALVLGGMVLLLVVLVGIVLRRHEPRRRRRRH